MHTALRSRHVLLGLTSTATIAAVAAISLLAVSSPASAAGSSQAKEGLGTATSFAVLAGTAIKNTGPSTIIGDVGVSPGSAITGFPPATVTGGTIHKTDGPATSAQADSMIAYTDLAGRPSTDETATPNLGGLTLKPGAYSGATDLSITGTLTLDAQNDPDAVFIFQTGQALNAAVNSNVALINGANPCNVFWKVGSSATLNTDVDFAGTVIAGASITADTGAAVTGRLLAQAAVTLGDNKITRPTCMRYPAGPVQPPAGPTSGTPTSSTPTSGTPTSGTPSTSTPSTSTPSTGAPTSGTPTTGTPSSGGTSTTTTSGSSGTGTPVATGLSSTSGPATGGAMIVVSGAGFQPGRTTVSMGGTTVPAASVTVLSSTRLTFKTPAHRAGRVGITVNTARGRSNRLIYTFTTTTTSLTTTTTTADTGAPTARLLELAALLLVAGYALTTIGRKRVIGRHRH